MDADGSEALIQPPNNIENQGRFTDRLTKVPKIIGLSFELAAVIIDRQVPLREDAELLISVQGTRCPIAKELGLDREPDGTSRGPTLGNDVSEFIGDGTKKPGADDAVHPDPGRGRRIDGVGEDMGFQRVLAEDVEEGRLPASEEGRGDVEKQRDQSADVLDSNCLSMEVEDDFGLLVEKSVVEAVIANLVGDIVAMRGSSSSRRGGARLGIAKASGGGVDVRLGGRGLALGCFSGREGSIAHFLRGVLGGSVAVLGSHRAGQGQARRGAAQAEQRWKRRRKAEQRRGALEAAPKGERKRAWSSLAADGV
jgi:hypothetical protein